MRKLRNETLVGLFILAGFACVFYLSVNLGDLHFPGLHETYTIKARFNSIQGLNPGSRVSLAGVKIGEVEHVHLDPKDYVAYIEMRLEKNVILYDDAIASIRTNGLIGDRFVHIQPGGSGIELKPGDTIIDTESAIDLEELIGKVAFGSVEK